MQVKFKAAEDKGSGEESSYRQIMKATSLFGGVQAFNIVVAVARSKVIALLLGPTGVGILGLFTATIELVASLTSFGLRTSAIKDIALAYSSKNALRIGTIIRVFRRWVWLTGMLGTIMLAVFSPLISDLTFGNKGYTIAFIWLSITLLFNQLSSGQLVVLQGMQRLQHLAKANVIGNISSLVVSLPLYFFFGIDGVVPALILSSITSFIISWYFAQNVEVQSIRVTKLRTFAEGKGMLKLGFFLSISGLLANATSYGVRIFISHVGGVEEVGFYSAGFQIINSYVGLIFTAMGTDYFPRLSGIAHINEKATTTINQQAEIAVLILAPIILIFLVCINWIIVLLYSSKFVEITPMIQWAAMGMFFKAASWSIAFIFLAKGSNKLFFLNELTTYAYLIPLNLLGYYFGGLEGLGISFLIMYSIYLIQVYYVAKVNYQFNFKSDFIQIFTIQVSLAICCLVVVKTLNEPYSNIVGLTLIVASSLYSFEELDKRIGLKKVLNKIKNRIQGKR